MEARKALHHLLNLPWLSQRRTSMPPPLADEAWSKHRADCKSKVARFAYTSFTHLAPDPFSLMHHEFSETYREDMWARTRGVRDATAVLRGHAKTSLKRLIKMIHACIYGREAFILVISSTSSLAEVELIRDELESNRLLNQGYSC